MFFKGYTDIRYTNHRLLGSTLPQKNTHEFVPEHFPANFFSPLKGTSPNPITIPSNAFFVREILHKLPHILHFFIPPKMVF